MFEIFKKKWYYILVVISVIVLLRFMNEEPKTITKTTIEYIDRVDTVTKVEIQKVPIKVYVTKTITEKGKDSIIYKSVADSTTIEANQFQTFLNSNNATAELKITTTGELLDVQGVINYTEKIKTVNITEFKNNSGLFAFGQTNTDLDNFGGGLDYVIRNKIIIGTSVNYNTQFNNTSINFKVGFRIF